MKFAAYLLVIVLFQSQVDLVMQDPVCLELSKVKVKFNVFEGIKSEALPNQVVKDEAFPLRKALVFEEKYWVESVSKKTEES